MNRFDPPNRPRKRPDSIRAEINQTRERMDHTIDALAARLRAGHVLEELLSLFRSPSGNGNGNGHGHGQARKDKLTSSAGAAVHAVVDNFKAHPLPWLVIGTGVAWMFHEKYEQERQHSAVPPPPDDSREPDDFAYPSSEHTVAATTRASAEEASSSFSTSASTPARDPDGPPTRVRVSSARDHPSGPRAADVATQAKQQFARAADEHPLEAGAAFLALGLLAGLLTPTPASARAPTNHVPTSPPPAPSPPEPSQPPRPTSSQGTLDLPTPPPSGSLPPPGSLPL